MGAIFFGHDVRRLPYNPNKDTDVLAQEITTMQQHMLTVINRGGKRVG